MLREARLVGIGTCLDTQAESLDFLPPDGEMADLIRQYDWEQTPLGKPSSWSPALRMMVRFMLANRFPHLLWWGPDYIQLYNDHYAPILGAKHPEQALGKPFRECWSEVYHILGPLVDLPFQGGPSTWTEDMELIIERHGFPEESHFMFSYSAIPDDTVPRGIGGVLATVHEITEKVLAERRVKILRDLGASVAAARTEQQACIQAIDIMAQHPKDVPFALIYLLDEASGELRLAQSTGIHGHTVGPTRVSLGTPQADAIWPLGMALESGKTQLRGELAAVLPEVPAGPWSQAPDSVAVLPIRSSNPDRPYGALVLGMSACIRPDERYLGFLELLAPLLATAITNTRAYEVEHRRAEALAEIDRAKTAFFSNVSHELRTPLTLMLAPLEDALSDPTLTPALRRNLGLARRNTERLQKLVNTLLDFSRVEAGRAQAFFAPVDLAELTSNFASTFRSAMDRAGLEFLVESLPLGEPVYVDLDMWEKIVLNLLSNAFKFTLEGSVRLCVYRSDNNAVLEVSDSGIGMDIAELPRLFDRFYRIEGAQARTHEGSGIGLALVQELVRLHGGSIQVESTLGEGTTFRVLIPFGVTHLPPGKIQASAGLATGTSATRAYLHEALSWLPHNDECHADSEQAGNPVSRDDKRFASTFGSRILLADDNADMRHYLGQVLGPLYAVEAVADGMQALAAARRERPDLIISDVMMPNMDGFDLLQALRADPNLAEIPVIMLSARAGDEARIEGLEAGADDYVVKPFHTRELLARVGAILELNALRHENAERFRAYVEASSDVVYRMSADWTEMTFLEGRNFMDDQFDPTRSWLDRYVLAEDHDLMIAAVKQAIDNQRVFELEHRVIRADGSIGWTFSRAVPLFYKGVVIEWLGTATDVTERRKVDDLVRESEARLQAIIEQLPAGVGVMDKTGKWTLSNSLMERYVPRAIPSVLPDRALRWRSWDDKGNLVPPERWPGQRVLRGETVMPGMEMLHTAENGEETWLRMSAAPLHSSSGEFIGASVVGQDITQFKRIEQALRETDRRKDQFLATLAHELRNPLAPLRNGLHILRRAGNDHETAARTYAMLDRQLSHMVRLVDDLMEVSRISGGKITLQKKPVELATLLHNAVETSRPLIDAAHHQLTLILPHEPLMLDADPMRFAQVVTNLLNNSAKYTDDGGQIWLTARREGDNAVVSVRDNGMGIPEAMLPRVFDLFTQADRTYTRAQGGLGIGLTLVRSLVEMHGGQVEATSAGPGRGSEFLIRIPLLANSPVPVDQQPRPDMTCMIAPRRILVVDDNRDAADSLGMLLDLLGGDVRVAYDAPTALAVFAAHQPELVLLDIGMPLMDGYELARRIREQPQGKTVMLAALTGWGQDDERRQSKEAGIDHHLIKPVDIEVLEKLLATLEGALHA